jgi:hypothetical protein
MLDVLKIIEIGILAKTSQVLAAQSDESACKPALAASLIGQRARIENRSDLSIRLFAFGGI